MSNQLKVAIGLAFAGLAAYLLGLGVYLVEVVQTWQDGDNEDKT
jgi:hypothetical protein|nr:MAG TPA: hypothetical protein [Caudoviricetes sp.]